jgi:small basic protein
MRDPATKWKLLAAGFILVAICAALLAFYVAETSAPMWLAMIIMFGLCVELAVTAWEVARYG